MKSTYTLREALPLIASVRGIKEDDITMICYEDGSKHKFNYSHDGETRYINLNAAQGGISKGCYCWRLEDWLRRSYTETTI